MSGRPGGTDRGEQAAATDVLGMDARTVKNKLYARHPGSGGQMPGPWTVIEEFRCIDLLAFSAWSSASDYARVGYEVKVSRADLRAELLNPHKRARNVEWCNEFYFAVPAGLLRPDEIEWDEPEWAPEDWVGERCPGWQGRQCASGWPKRRKTYFIEVPKPVTSEWSWERHEKVVCPTCKGKGVVAASRVEREAPTCWIPRDVGLVVVTGRGTKLVKRSPLRSEVPTLESPQLGQLVRWISMRPDPRHAARRAQREEIAA